MASETPSAPTAKRMKLRYPGTCRACHTELSAGQTAIYHRNLKQVECLTCAQGAVTFTASTTMVPAPMSVAPIEPEPREPQPEQLVESGIAGASARREHQRRVAKREERVRSRHPKLGGLILAVADEPQSTRAWDVGARGEEILARRLNALGELGVLVLHDRRIPGTKANIDHIVVAPSGVFVIDAKKYKGRPHLKVEGGVLRPRVEKLMVGGRDCTKLVAGVTKQVDLVRAALSRDRTLDPAPVSGMLCFVQADWPLIGGSFAIGGVAVVWPKKAVERITRPSEAASFDVAAVHRWLAGVFPIA